MVITPTNIPNPSIVVTPTVSLLLTRLIGTVTPAQLPEYPTVTLHYDDADDTVLKILQSVPDIGTCVMVAANFVFAVLYGVEGAHDVPREDSPDQPPTTAVEVHAENAMEVYSTKSIRPLKFTATPNHGSKTLKTSIDFHLLPMDGVADTSNPTPTRAVIRFSTKYFEKVFTQPPAQAVHEFFGVLVHELVHAYQSNGNDTANPGVIEGIADYVRLVALLDPPHWRQNTDCEWDIGYEATAYFFCWIDRSGLCPCFTQKLNFRLLDEPWSLDLVLDLTKFTVTQLWDMYCKAVLIENPQKSIVTVTPTMYLLMTRLISDVFPIQIPVHPTVRIHYDVSDAVAQQVLANVPELGSAVMAAANFVYAVLYGVQDPPTSTPETLATTNTLEPQSASVDPVTKRFQFTRTDHGSLVLKTTIDLHLLSMDGVADTANPTPSRAVMRFSTVYLKKIFAKSLDQAVFELMGVLVHELVHAYQANGKGTADSGVIEGVADYVRMVASLGPAHWRQSTDRAWNAGYDTTAYFFFWIDQSGVCPLFTQRLNYRMLDEAYSTDLILDLTGYEVDRLWDMYCEDVAANKPKHVGP